MAVKNRTKGRSPKLDRKWKGPFLVLERYSDVTYLVAEGLTKQKVIHFDRLKPYRGEKNPTWMKTSLRKHKENREKNGEGGPALQPSRVNPVGETGEIDESEEEDYQSASDESDCE